MNDKKKPEDVAKELEGVATDELADLTEQVTSRLQDGKAIDLEEYGRRFPRCAGPIRRLPPTLRGLASLDRATEPGGDKGLDRDVVIRRETDLWLEAGQAAGVADDPMPGARRRPSDPGFAAEV